MQNNDLEKTVQGVAEKINSKEEEKNLSSIIQIVIFELDKEEYAVEIMDIKEIIEVPEITPIPNAPEFIAGIFNLRGRIVVVLDLERRFDLVRDYEKDLSEENIIVTEINENSYGVIVDTVLEIKNINKDDIQPAPEIISTKIGSNYIEGVLVVKEDEQNTNEKNEKENDESRLIILLDLKKMLQEKELLSVSNVVKKVADNDKKEK